MQITLKHTAVVQNVAGRSFPDHQFDVVVTHDDGTVGTYRGNALGFSLCNTRGTLPQIHEAIRDYKKQHGIRF